MGFLNKMLAANGFHLGTVESPDFPGCVVQVANGVLVIRDKTLNGKVADYFIDPENIEVFELAGCGGSWAKYRIVFKDGKSAIITQEIITESQKRAAGTSVTTASIERYIKEKRFAPTININHVNNFNADESILSSESEKVAEEKNKKPTCPNCGADVDDDMLFCGECGAKLR